MEMVALEEARKNNWPVLGICRGAQMINVYSGGTLIQHIGDHHFGIDHPIQTVSNSLLRRAMMGSTDKIVSLHHQAVDDLGVDLMVSAWSPDHIPEAIESIDGRCLGVQFHPEMDSNAMYSKGIFYWLVAAAARRAGKPAPPYPKPNTQLDIPRRKKGRKRFNNPVTISWLCPECPLKFKAESEYLAHMVLLHGADESLLRPSELYYGNHVR